MIGVLLRVARFLTAARSVSGAVRDLLALHRARGYAAGFTDGRAFERGTTPATLPDDREAGL